MNEQDEWGPVILHDGRARPVADGVYVRVWLRCGAVVEAIVGRNAVTAGGKLIPCCRSVGDAWVWGTNGDNEGGEVLRYQFKRPRGFQQLQQLIETLPVVLQEMEEA